MRGSMILFVFLKRIALMVVLTHTYAKYCSGIPNPGAILLRGYEIFSLDIAAKDCTCLFDDGGDGDVVGSVRSVVAIWGFNGKGPITSVVSNLLLIATNLKALDGGHFRQKRRGRRSGRSKRAR